MRHPLILQLKKQQQQQQHQKHILTATTSTGETTPLVSDELDTISSLKSVNIGKTSAAVGGSSGNSPLNSPGRNNGTGPSGGIVIYYSPTTSDPEQNDAQQQQQQDRKSSSHLTEKQYEISV